MPLIINDVRNRMKCNLIKPEEMINPLSLSSTHKYKVKLNNEIPVEEQLKVYTPVVIDLEKQENETPVDDPYNMTEKYRSITYTSTGDAGLRGTGMVEEKKTLSLQDTISLEERRLRRLYSHKPDFCGSCKAEQRFDGNKYCHNCQRDPHYNPDGLNIGSNGKTIHDYDLLKRLQHETFDATESVDSYLKYKSFMKNYDA